MLPGWRCKSNGEVSINFGLCGWVMLLGICCIGCLGLMGSVGVVGIFGSVFGNSKSAW